MPMVTTCSLVCTICYTRATYTSQNTILGISVSYCISLNILAKSYCSTVHFRRITSIYQPTNAHIISHKTLLKTL